MLPAPCPSTPRAGPAAAGSNGGRLLPAWLALTLVEEFGQEAEVIARNWAERFGHLIDATGAPLQAARHDEYGDVLQLLLESAATPGSHPDNIARWIALSCMGQDHLWEDLGLPERPALSGLIARHFPALHARNTGNMRWKKFFYKQLCERAEVFACRAPSCAACSEYRVCFVTGN